MNRYAERKAEARETAWRYQVEFAGNAFTWGELAERQTELERLAKRYGLLRELRENGLI